MTHCDRGEPDGEKESNPQLGNVSHPVSGGGRMDLAFLAHGPKPRKPTSPFAQELSVNPPVAAESDVHRPPQPLCLFPRLPPHPDGAREARDGRWPRRPGGG